MPINSVRIDLDYNKMRFTNEVKVIKPPHKFFKILPWNADNKWMVRNTMHLNCCNRNIAIFCCIKFWAYVCVWYLYILRLLWLCDTGVGGFHTGSSTIFKPKQYASMRWWAPNAKYNLFIDLVFNLTRTITTKYNFNDLRNSVG